MYSTGAYMLGIQVCGYYAGKFVYTFFGKLEFAPVHAGYTILLA